MPKRTRESNAETQVANALAEYEPAIAKLGRALRAKLRSRLPGLVEVVYFYASQRSLVISYSPSERGYEGVFSLAIRPDGARLHFGQGARLSKSDPHALLEGHGKTVRHVELASARDLDRPEIEALMSAALALAGVELDPRARGSIVSRVEAQQQRATRAKQAARPAGARRKKSVRP